MQTNEIRGLKQLVWMAVQLLLGIRDPFAPNVCYSLLSDLSCYLSRAPSMTNRISQLNKTLSLSFVVDCLIFGPNDKLVQFPKRIFPSGTDAM